MSPDARAFEWRSNLGGCSYSSNAGDFVRFRTDANDDAVAGIVRAVASAGEELCAEFRTGLEASEIETLRLFAMRRTLQGRRTASLVLLNEAIDCFALLPGLDNVPWESWFKAILFLVRYLGGSITSTRERFEVLADRPAILRGRIAADSMDRIEELSQCQLTEVMTTYGTGFVEILVFRNTPTIGLFGAPTSLGVNLVEYRPTSNLAQLAAGLADALDATGDMLTGPLGQDQLAATSFSLVVPGSYLHTAGCLGFVADSRVGASSLNIFVAELSEESDAGALAEAAGGATGQAAVSDTHRLILFCAQPNFDYHSEEEDVDFHAVTAIARDALLDPATTSWGHH